MSVTIRIHRVIKMPSVSMRLEGTVCWGNRKMWQNVDEKRVLVQKTCFLSIKHGFWPIKHENFFLFYPQRFYSCKCLPGFMGNGEICKDVNECLQPRTCHRNAFCINKPGTYSAFKNLWPTTSCRLALRARFIGKFRKIDYLGENFIENTSKMTKFRSRPQIFERTVQV